MSYQFQHRGQHADANFNQADDTNVDAEMALEIIPDVSTAFASGAAPRSQARTDSTTITMTETSTAEVEHEILQLTLRARPIVTWYVKSASNKFACPVLWL